MSTKWRVIDDRTGQWRDGNAHDAYEAVAAICILIVAGLVIAWLGSL